MIYANRCFVFMHVIILMQGGAGAKKFLCLLLTMSGARLSEGLLMQYFAVFYALKVSSERKCVYA
jgi:hypothetical protein